MGFANSCQRILNLDRRAARKQRAKQQSQVQIIRHDESITRIGWPVKWFLRLFCARAQIGFVGLAPSPRFAGRVGERRPQRLIIGLTSG